MSMKGLLVATLLLIVLISSYEAAPWPNNEADAANAPKSTCPTICTFEHNPVCGYNGICYRVYPNQCGYDSEKCQKKNNLETVDNSLCDLAQKDTHPSYKMCTD